MMRLVSGALALLLVAPSMALADTVDVTVSPGGALEFSPSDLVIDLGDTVRWTWDVGFHTVTSGEPGAPDGAFRSGDPEGPGTVYEVVFDQALLDAFPMIDNVYPYHCEPHGSVGMVGSVTVRMDPTPTEDVSWGAIKSLY